MLKAYTMRYPIKQQFYELVAERQRMASASA